MDPTLPVYLRWQGKTVGPFTAEQLRELIPTGAVTPDTEIALEPEGPWVRLDSVPLGGAVFPTVAFKTPTYERANTADTAPIDLRDIIAAAQRPASSVPPATSASPAAQARPVSAEHDVPSLLRFNQTLDEQRGGYVLTPKPKRRSRRRRDFSTLIVGGGLLIYGFLFSQAMPSSTAMGLGLFLQLTLQNSPFFMLFATVCFAFYGSALYWIMYVVMDDY